MAYLRSGRAWILIGALCGLLAAAALPTFERVIMLEDTSEDSASVSIGDLSGDGLPDLILAKGRHTPLHDRVLIADGKGGYLARNLGNQPDRTYSAALADIDLDSDLDVVVSNDAPDLKLVYKNDGKANFTRTGKFGDAKWVTRYVTLADFNRDRYPDIVVANRGGNTPVASYVCFNDHEGEFADCRKVWSGSATSIAAADIDADGAIDLFIPHRDGGQSQVLWNDGRGGFNEWTDIGPARTAARMGVAGDLNGDGRADLAYIEERMRAVFAVLNLGNRKFSEPFRLPGGGKVPYALAIADLNRDRLPDIVAGWIEAPGSVYWNQGSGRDFLAGQWNDGRGTVYGMVFHDVDGDGWMDIIAARSGAPNAIWFAKPPR